MGKVFPPLKEVPALGLQTRVKSPPIVHTRRTLGKKTGGPKNIGRETPRNFPKLFEKRQVSGPHPKGDPCNLGTL